MWEEERRRASIEYLTDWYSMVGEILNQGDGRLQNPSTPRAINDCKNLFEDG